MTTAFTLSSIKAPNPMFTKSGEEHGLVKVLPNSVPDSGMKRFKESDRPHMEKLRKEESKMVTVTYINTKGKNERLPMNYCRWDGDPLLAYHFIPEHDYEVPKGLVNQVNAKKNPKRSGLMDVNGKELLTDEMEMSEHRFVPSASAAGF